MAYLLSMRLDWSKFLVLCRSHDNLSDAMSAVPSCVLWALQAFTVVKELT